MALETFALVTVAEAKAFMDVTDSDRDTKIEGLVNTHSRWLMTETGCEFKPWKAATTRRFAWDGGSYLDFGRYQAQSVSAVTLNPTGDFPRIMETTEWQLEPVDSVEGVYDALFVNGQYGVGTSFGFPGRGSGIVEVVGVWGYPSVPSDVKQACLRLVDNSFKSEVAFYADADMDVATQDVAQGQIPIDVWDVVRSHKRYRIGAA